MINSPGVQNECELIFEKLLNLQTSIYSYLITDFSLLVAVEQFGKNEQLYGDLDEHSCRRPASQGMTENFNY